MTTIRSMPATLLHVRLYSPSSEQHGGGKRTKQLAELIAELARDRAVREVAVPDLGFSLAKLLGSCLLVHALLDLVRCRLSWRGAVTYALRGSALLDLVGRIRPSLVLLETGPGRSLLLPQVLSRHGIAFLVFPHNIEGMVPGQSQASFPGKWQELAWERSAYAAARRTFAISTLDTAILQTLGVTATCLPYYPARPDRDMFRSIRERRQASPKDYVLVLGTVRNPPTRIGMELLLAELAGGAQQGGPYVVAGYGTEELAHHASGRISIRGGVSDAELGELLVGCRYILVRQIQTTGLMTRMSEMNLAGVPMVIVGDYLQADHHERYGIYRYSQLSGIDEAPQQGECLPPPQAAVDELSTLMQALRVP